tara:strand:+ start:1178 stop:1699 length:522 start_codon:yes stop_codon:yes gene_type:complete
MACTSLSAGRLEVCKDTVGGLAAVYFINFEDTTFSVDASTGLATESGNNPDAYKYDLRGVSTFEQNLQTSRENGTTFVEQTLTVSLKKQDSTTNKEVKLLAYGRPRVLIEDNNGNVFVMGHEYGAELTTAATSSGAAMADKSGYEMSFVASEKVLAPFTQEVLATTYNIVVGS